ncbi:hypothetical protein [Acetobacter sp. DsW_54]|uniref:DUF7226 domain-containing protein n=1 Tax=Acetobacter sp. DsW_54 TaxID=1670660 RepID=UPI000A36A264|nr:hypothetical protein [Acetobacter sp. DsW_54]OUI97687.1 hypothetical protein HK20_10860 [Acetobacter sp. DsW_54]
MDTSDFLQADDIYKVILVPSAVARGFQTDDEIEEFIGVDSDGRQGRYYRLAAEKFGLVFNENNLSTLTVEGEDFIALEDDSSKINFIANIMCKTEVFSQAIEYLESSNPKPSLTDLEDWFFDRYPGSKNTAERRFSTFKKYLRVTRFI